MKRRTFFPIIKSVRLAPVQNALVEHMVQKFPAEFPNENDYIRKAITLQAKTLLSAAEFELICNRAYKDMPVEVR